MFEEIEHTADVALRVRATDLPGLFIAAARGMFHLMGADLSAIPVIERRVELSAADAEALLVDWLNELLYLREVYGEAYTVFQIESLTSTSLSANVRGTKVARLPGRRIKAATFYDLRIQHEAEGYEVTVVFDV